MLITFVLGAAQSADAAGRQTLKTPHVPAAVASLTPIGRLPSSQRLNLAIGLPLRNEAELDALLRELYDPASTSYHHYLRPEEFTARFGPTEQDYQALADFAAANGLNVTHTHPNRLILDVAGAVSDIETTFGVTLRVYQHPTEARTFYAPDTQPSVAYAGPILDVSGLDTYSLPHPNSRPVPATMSAKASPSSGTGPIDPYTGQHTYWGNDFRAAYVPGTTLTGSGQNVGLLQFDGFYTSDITSYESQAGLPNVPLTVVPVNGGVNNPGSGSSEVSLDIEMVISMAPGVSGVYVFEAPNPSPWVDLLNAMVAYTNISQFSCSWGGGGVDASAENIFKQMGAQGQSFFNATGDSDAFISTISFPSESTNITQVGGTTLTTGAGASYSSETVWNWGYNSNCRCYVGSSGGVSTYYGLPIYQLGLDMSLNQGSATMRNVPDVALTGDNVWVIYGNGQTGAFGGTSCAAPLWAGFTALVNQQAAAAGRPRVGFLNPILYRIGRGSCYTLDFHDTTTGDNTWPSSPSKYYGVPGYDLCTGWGTPNGTSLINRLVAGSIILSNSFTLAAEGCPNGGVDPGETVTVNFGLQNLGTANTTNLVATLLATGGVLSPSGPQSYGVLNTNGTAVALPFTFTASGTCGGTAIATLQLQDGAAYLGTLTFAFSLGHLNAATVFAQAFDGVTAPALPAGWSTSKSGFQSVWVTSTSARDTLPNSAYSAEASKAGVNELDSPAITLPANPTQLTFRHNYNLESGYDGGVLEISINGGSWTDIVAAGGSFAGGGYTGTLGSSTSNPLGGRSAWTGNSGGFITTAVNLPATASGQTIQLRWRCGTDRGTSGAGWYVDTIAVSSLTYVCCTASADVGVAVSASPDPVLAGQNLTYSLTVTNLGPAPASSITLTDALPAGITLVSTSPGFVQLGGQVVVTVASLASGAGTNFTVVVTPNAGGLTTNKVTVAAATTDPNVANNAATVVTTVNAAPTISVQPSNQAVLLGANATFQVTAAGTGPLAYQWRFNGNGLSGATSSALTLTSVQATQAGTYSVLVTNNYGSVLSSNAILTVLIPPSITTQPSNQTVLTGSNATFSVTANGTLPLAYRWRFNGSGLSGATDSSLTLTSVQAAQAGTYSVLVTNDYGSMLSSNAILTAFVPPAITTQPSNQMVLVGSNVSFSVAASGTLPLAYQWWFNGSSLAGATESALTLISVQAAQAGSYSVLVTNNYGSLFSSNAVLTVLEPPRILSFSVQSNASFLLGGQGIPGQSYVLLVASNLTPSTVWSPIQTNQADTNGLVEFTDPGVADHPQRFYRFTQ